MANAKSPLVAPAHVWGTALTGEISDVYGPDHWPRHIEPPVGTLEASTSSGPLDIYTMGVAGDRLAVLASCYEQTGVLVVDEAGHVEAVDDFTQPPEAHAEYHFRFRQVTNPTSLTMPIDEIRFARGPRGHVDAEPALAGAAQRLRMEAWPNPVDMVRFTAADGGAEQWLRWDARTTCWQTWDDPRTYYAGNPNDVLDTAGLVDARGSADPQLCLDDVLDDLPPSHHADRFDVELTSSDSFDL